MRTSRKTPPMLGHPWIDTLRVLVMMSSDDVRCYTDGALQS